MSNHHFYYLLALVFFINSCATFDPATYNVAYQDLSENEKTVTSNYDKFEDYTSFDTYKTRVYPDINALKEAKEEHDVKGNINMKWMPHHIYMSGSVLCEGNVQGCNDTGAFVTFDSYSQTGWKLLDNAKIIILYDGKKYVDSDPIEDRTTLTGSNVLEIISTKLSQTELKEIAYADSVSARIGMYEINMSNTKRANLRLLLDEVREQDS